jgi:hypothetical protein
LQRPVTAQARQLFGAQYLAPDSCVWHVWDYNGTSALLDEITVGVMAGMKIVQGSTTWNVNQAIYSPITSRWQCLCSKQARGAL